MPHVWLDDLARLAAGPGTRRSLLRRLAAGLTATLMAATADAAVRTRRPPCRKAGKSCSSRQRCCAGARCRRGVCRCLPGRKPCAGACIPRGRSCPRRDGGGGGGCPPNQTCCNPGTKPCAGVCIPTAGCCPSTDCTGACHTGQCLQGACERKPTGTPCGADDQLRCNSRGACAETCGTADDCPQFPEPTTPEEFCRRIECNGGICEVGSQLDYTHVPDHLQTPGDCILLECIHTVAGGVGYSSSLSNNDVPLNPGPCTQKACTNFAPIPQPAGHSCSDDGSLVCDGNHNCVPAASLMNRMTIKTALNRDGRTEPLG